MIRNSHIADERVVDELVRRILGWKAAADRFLKRDRGWIPRWRFAPLTRAADAIELLSSSHASYRIERAQDGQFTVRLVVGNHEAFATGDALPRTITLALAGAFGLVPDVPLGDVNNHPSVRSFHG
jgi:hypothetical protein